MTPPTNKTLDLDLFVAETLKKAADKGYVQKKDVESAKAAINQIIANQVAAGKRNLVEIAEERLGNDDTYTLAAWIEDVQEYLDRTLKARGKK